MLAIGDKMNFLRIENNEKDKSILTILKVLLPITYVFKLWFEAELIYNSVGASLGVLFGRILSYAVNGGLGFLFAFVAVSWSYSIFMKSKFCPVDENCNCKINKQTYTAICYFVICITNLIGGVLNFVPYAFPISTVFSLLLMPRLITLFAICGIIAILNTMCKKDELKELITSMAIPSIILLLLLR